MKLSKALTFLENVTNKTMAVPMRRYAGSTGRTAQGESPLVLLRKFRIGRVGAWKGLWNKVDSIANSTTAIWMCRE